MPSARDMATLARWAIIAAGTLQFIAIVLWSLWVVRAYRRDLKRSREGLCMQCGFDLRESKDRCPECGSPIFKK